MKIAVLTLGCRINQAESLGIEQSLQGSGHQLVDISGNPDICIINTCAVTSKAGSQSRQLVNKAVRNKAKVIVTGCYAELDKELLKNINNVQIVDNSSKASIVKMIPPTSSGVVEVSRVTRSRPIIKVQEGCNFSCSYCVIPMLRGKSRSLPDHAIISRIRSLESLGHKEVVLSGIHLGTYGMDLKPKTFLSDLIEKVLKETIIPRIRLSSLEIREIDDRLIELLTDDRICNHLHIPLQSGDDTILKLMNRTYTINEFSEGIERIISKCSGLGLGTDVIVGFPGEGDAEFSNSKEFIDSMPFTYLHVFPYSSRPNTRAAKYPGHVDDQTKKQRVSELRQTGMKKKKNYIKAHVGAIVDLIVESSEANKVTGTSGNYIKVLIEGGMPLEEGMLVSTRITGYRNGMAVGTPVIFPKPLNI